jgi:hypothetical protein
VADIDEHHWQIVAAAASDLPFGEESGLWDLGFALVGERLRIRTAADIVHTACCLQKAVEACSEQEMGVVLWRHVGLLACSAGCEANQIEILQKATAVSGLPGLRFSDLGSEEAAPEPVAVVDTPSWYTQVEEDSGPGLFADGLQISR